ncbi:competence protein CoiA [Kitasatospora sp. DSM 101779]|uniref:competence protein CoiA n=1 Tax=Kitasatospora sp. DSM 101779 TaxID=2853165 RepID=UPI0021D848B8|nr:competence protein CoiA [Kitasatospora sp. DSM 101779]MCU7820621.1 competence protein CoiA [Kitasatospora sp. DSM 101779]
MVFVGEHAQWGRIDVTLPDLGCGRDRSGVHRTRPAAPVTCYECAWPVHLVHKPHQQYDLWFLRHADHAPHCAAKAAGEGLQHHLLKLDLAAHARAAGWQAAYEVAAPDGSWRADVLATSPDGRRRVALEAQTSAVSTADVERRTARYRADGIEVCWFTDRRTVPWLDAVPAVRVERPEDGGPVQVVAGPARFVPEWCEDRADCELCECANCGAGVPGPLPCAGHGEWRPADPLPLARFVAAICADTTRAVRVDSEWDTDAVRWTTRQYLALREAEHRAAPQRRQAIVRAGTAQRRARSDSERHRAAVEALMTRQRQLRPSAAAFVRRETGLRPAVGADPEPAFAMGVPITVSGRPYAVICPVAGRVAALRTQLSPLLLFAADTRERDRIAAQAAPGQRIEILDRTPDPAAPPPAVPQQGVPQHAETAVRTAVHRMLGLDRI